MFSDGEGSADAADGGSAWNNPGEGWGNYGELPAPVGAALEEPLPETVKVVFLGAPHKRFLTSRACSWLNK